MLDSIIFTVAPFVLTLALAGAIRAFGGAERGARAAGIAVMLGFLVSWGFVLKPGWIAVDDFSRIGHIALGAAMVGLALDLLSPKRLWAAAAAAVVILISTWASVTGNLAVSGTLTFATALAVAALSAFAFLIIARLDASRTRGITSLVLLGMAALGLALVARVTGAPALASTGLMLALAVAAFAVLQAAVKLPVGDSIVLGAGATLLALAWALAQAVPDARLALVMVPLILFAEGTAQRVPLPQARVSVILYPLVLAGIAALPLALAGLAAYILVQS
jgi:hypothetical protein